MTAKNGVPAVGKRLGQFVIWLTTLGVSYDQIHLIGFSLGAHVVGNAGRETNGQIRRITGLYNSDTFIQFSTTYSDHCNS